MNIYVFYLKQNMESDVSTATVYCYTDKKKMAEEFKKQRNMDRFILVKKNIDKDKIPYIENKYNRYKLRYGNFYTKSDIFGKRVSVNILCTWNEEESIIKNSERLWEEFSPSLFDCRVFKDDYLRSLEELLFIQFYGFYKSKFIEYSDYFYQPYYSSYGPVEGFKIEEFNSSYQYDELNLFLRFFKNTFIDNNKEDL